jgi:hypothetical protein
MISNFYSKLIYDATAITIFFRRQAEKSLGLLRIKLQKLTFCRNATYSIKFLNIFIIFSIFNLFGCTIQELKIQEIIPCEYSSQEGICDTLINGKKEYSILIPKDSKIETWNQLSNFIYFKSRISTGFIIKFNRPFLLNEKEVILSSYKSNYNFNGIFGTIEGFDMGDDYIYSFVYVGNLLKEKQKEKKEDQKSFGKYQSLPFQILLNFKSDLFSGEIETNQEIKVTKE